jgi:hypothetical protein
MVKKTFLIIFILLTSFVVPILAERSGIIVQVPGGWGPQTRSGFTSVPQLSQDRDTIFIYSEYRISSLEVIISDNIGNIVQSSIVTLEGHVEYPYLLNLATGDYMITLRQGTNYLRGYFVIAE